MRPYRERNSPLGMFVFVVLGHLIHRMLYGDRFIDNHLFVEQDIARPTTFILYNRSTRTDGRHTYIARSTMGMMVGDTFMLYNRSTRTDGRHTHTAGGAMGMMVGDVWSLRGI